MHYLLVCFNIHAVTIGCGYCGGLIAKDKSVECGNIGTYYAQETGPGIPGLVFCCCWPAHKRLTASGCCFIIMLYDISRGIIVRKA